MAVASKKQAVQAMSHYEQFWKGPKELKTLKVGFHNGHPDLPSNQPDADPKHGQKHIFETVPKQPFAFSPSDFLKRFAAIGNNKPAKPVTTKEWEGNDPMNGHAKSKSIVECTITIKESGEQFTFPMWTSATVMDVQELIGAKAGIDPGLISFYTKQGCTYRTLYRTDCMARNAFVKGLTTFKRQRVVDEHPHCIIGAGHIGLRMGLWWIHRMDFHDFVIVDREKRVGGTSWLYQANQTSKLQTETGVYHLDWDWYTDIPEYFSTPWPSRDDLLWHFDHVCKEQGLMPYVRLNTNVAHIEPVKRDYMTAKLFPTCFPHAAYELTLDKLQDRQSTGESEVQHFAGIYFFPGNLTLPRREEYPGEDTFGGAIEYGMFNTANYDDCVGNNVCIVGHGAFAVENVRTCTEFGCKKIIMICRRRNISCPRVVSWLANRSLTPISAARFLNSAQMMFDLIGVDVWNCYAVQANKDRSQVNIMQKARFGIGDIYFLTIYYGKMEVIEDPLGIKRVGPHTVFTGSGLRFDVAIILKLLGFVGEPDNDRLMKAKELVGWWVNGDSRRFLVAEPVSVMAQRFASTSFSPGAISWGLTGVHFAHFPQDLQIVLDANMMPRHPADDSDKGTYRPAYVVDARHGTTTAMALSIHCPHLAELESTNALMKPYKQRMMHPIKQYVAEAKADWDHYCRMLIAEGWDKMSGKPYPEYPFTVEKTRELVIQHMTEAKEAALWMDFEDLDLPEGSIPTVDSF